MTSLSTVVDLSLNGDNIYHTMTSLLHNTLGRVNARFELCFPTKSLIQPRLAKKRRLATGQEA